MASRLEGPGLRPVRSVVDKVAMGQVFLRVLPFSAAITTAITGPHSSNCMKNVVYERKISNRKPFSAFMTGNYINIVTGNSVRVCVCSSEFRALTEHQDISTE